MPSEKRARKGADFMPLPDEWLLQSDYDYAIYPENLAREILNQAREVILWIKQQQ